MMSETDFDELWAQYMQVLPAFSDITPDEYAAQGWSMGRLLHDVRLAMQLTGDDPADVAHAIAAEFEARGYPTLMTADVDTITLTTARAESSYGVPVLVLDGTAYGPADMTPAGVTAAELVRQWAERFIG